MAMHARVAGGVRNSCSAVQEFFEKSTAARTFIWEPDVGHGHRGTGAVVRMVAVK